MNMRNLFFSVTVVFLLLGVHLTHGLAQERRQRIVFPERTELDLDALDIDGELNRPGEFYFQQRDSEGFGSLVERRKNFHHQMLRDVVMSQ
jgi:hypothetical protein